MDLRRGFVSLALQEGVHVADLCRRFGINRKTGYKWIVPGGLDGASLADRSRKPLSSPKRMAPGVEAKIVSLRKQHPAWGARKLLYRLEALGEESLPAASTITEVLRRNGFLDPAGAVKQKPLLWHGSEFRLTGNLP